MEKAKDPKDKTGAQAAGEGTPQRDAEATSGETLGDIEDSAKVSTGGGAGSESSSLEGASPRPQTGGGRADGSDTGGPM